ncbi:MAG: ABC transporter permease [Flavobacteriales bacterium]
MNTSFYIAKKYFLTKKKTSSANFINITAILGIIIGTMALFIILSTFSGLEKLTVELLFEKNATLKIEPQSGKKLNVTPLLLKQIKRVSEVTSVASLIEEKVQLTYKGRGDFIYLRGVDSTYKEANLDSLRLFGELPIYEDQIALANSVVAKLDITLEDARDSIKLYVPKVGKIKINTPQNAFKIENVVMTGVFYEENPVAYTTIQLARELLNLDRNQVYALEISHNHTLSDEDIKLKIEEEIGSGYKILTQRDQLGSFYKMLKTENIMVYLIFTLILIISTFNLIGSIIILIIEKRDDLVTLHAMGMDFNHIKKIFLIEGFLVSFIGGVIGIFLGLILIITQQQFGIVRVNSALSYPVEITGFNFGIVFITVIVIGILASLAGTVKLTKEFLKKH